MFKQFKNVAFLRHSLKALERCSSTTREQHQNFCCWFQHNQNSFCYSFFIDSCNFIWTCIIQKDCLFESWEINVVLCFRYLLGEFWTNGYEKFVHFINISFHFARLISSGPVFLCFINYSSGWFCIKIFFEIDFRFWFSYDRCYCVALLSVGILVKICRIRDPFLGKMIAFHHSIFLFVRDPMWRRLHYLTYRN